VNRPGYIGVEPEFSKKVANKNCPMSHRRYSRVQRSHANPSKPGTARSFPNVRGVRQANRSLRFRSLISERG
jgi:hypothetical protein